MAKFQNKYRIDTTRLPDWDYASNAAYFITICTKNKLYHFGKVIDEEMKLSEIGKLAEKYWYEIPQHFPSVKLDAFIVMPNHVHGIIVIDKSDNEQNNNVETPNWASLKIKRSNKDKTQNIDKTNVETPFAAANLGVSTNKWKAGTLGVIVNQYKRVVTLNARKINPDFAWQSRYYEHIIRNEKSFLKIGNYIINNPLKWLFDEYNTEIRNKKL